MEGQSLLENLEGHVVICNCNEKVRSIVGELQAGTSHEPLDIVLLVQDRYLWEKNPSWHPEDRRSMMFIVLYGSPFDEELLFNANIKKARAAIILADPNQGNLADAQSTLTAVAIEKQNPQVHTVQELILSINRDHLKALNVDEVVCIGEMAEKLIAQSCITPGVKNIFANLLSTGVGTPQILLPKITKEVSGKTYREISRMCILGDAPFIVIGFVLNSSFIPLEDRHQNMITNTFIINPKKFGKDVALTEGDKLIVIAYEQIPELHTFIDAIS